MSIVRLPLWPPYVVSFFTFLLTFTTSAIVVGLYLVATAWVPDQSSSDLIEAVANEFAGSPTALLMSAAVSSSTLAFVALVLSRRHGSVRSRMRLFGPTPVDAFAAALGVIGVGMMLDTTVVMLGLEGEGSLGTIHTTLASLSPAKLVLAGVLIGVFPGVGEELFFRGYLLRRIQASQGTFAALLWSSVIFGLFHFDAIHSPTSAMIGLYIGVMVLISGSLWVGIVAHTINNFTAAITVGHSFDPSLGSVWFMIGLNAGIVSLWYVWRRNRRFAPVAYW